MSNDQGTERAHVAHSNRVQRSNMFMALPELFVVYRKADWQLGAGLGALFILTRAPTSQHGKILPEVRESGPCDDIRCAPANERLNGERPYAQSAQASVSLYGGYCF